MFNWNKSVLGSLTNCSKRDGEPFARKRIRRSGAMSLNTSFCSRAVCRSASLTPAICGIIRASFDRPPKLNVDLSLFKMFPESSFNFSMTLGRLRPLGSILEMLALYL